MGTARLSLTLLAVIASWVAAYLLRFDLDVPADRWGQVLVSLPLVVLLQYGALRLAGVHRHSWRHTAVPDLLPVIIAVLATGTALAGLRLLAPPLVEISPAFDVLHLPFGVVGGYVVVAIALLVGGRILRRMQTEHREAAARPHDEDAQRVLLLGAGRAGSLVASELAARPDLGLVPVGFVDDSPLLLGRRLAGLDVLGTTADIGRLAVEHDIDEVVITIASADGPTMRRLIETCEDAGFHPRIVPGVSELLAGNVSLSWFRPVAPEDLLGRDPVELELDALSELLSGEVVLVTGAGGSIGAELARQVGRFDPAALVLVERSEPALWAIDRELHAAYRDVAIVPALADVADRDRMDALLIEHRPSVVLHAAAHKHVPMMEDNPGEAVKNNVLGTRTMVDLARDRGVVHFVNISTDKAVNPTSVMGATKRLAERYVQHVADQTGRPYVSVRFGNVLGSAGSVLPIFEEQIAAGGPVTVTHPEMRRYFMTIPEASQLVLQAAVLGRAGEILVLDMGEPVRIVELARSMIRLCGLEPERDIEVVYTGVRPGEKLYEELALTEEGSRATRHPKVFIGCTPTPNWATAAEDLADLASVTDWLEAAGLRKLLARHVPEYLLQPPTANGSGPTTNGHGPAIDDAVPTVGEAVAATEAAATEAPDTPPHEPAER